MKASKRLATKAAKMGPASAPIVPALSALPDPPDPKTVVAQAVLVSPGGTLYQVIRTNQRDATDE